MTEKDKSVFVELMTAVAELHGKKLSNPLLRLYWLALKRYSLEAIEQALNQHVMDPDKGQFMPKPADLVGYIEGNAATQALQAWTKVIQAIKHFGAYSSVVFDDPLIHVVLQNMGGWVTLCQGQERELPFRAKEFERLYVNCLNQKIQNSRRIQKHPKRLAGIDDHSNTNSNFSTKLPVLIGDQKCALAVYLSGHDDLIIGQELSVNMLSQENKNED